MTSTTTDSRTQAGARRGPSRSIRVHPAAPPDRRLSRAPVRRRVQRQQADRLSRDPGDHACEHIAHAGGRHPGVAAIANTRAAHQPSRRSSRRPSTPRFPDSAQRARARNRDGLPGSGRSCAPGVAPPRPDAASGSTSSPRADARARRFNPSASTTAGEPLAAACPNRVRAHSSCPRPGPTASTSARSMSAFNSPACSMPRQMSSGRAPTMAATFSRMGGDGDKSGADSQRSFAGHPRRSSHAATASDDQQRCPCAPLCVVRRRRGSSACNRRRRCVSQRPRWTLEPRLACRAHRTQRRRHGPVQRQGTGPS